ncbi:hypothetical protein [Qipengyuania sp.]|uniref:hypothetical protein n=1 Tax=Qipengyuania sp. TaxID=2004515 RepID=UPI0037362A1C
MTALVRFLAIMLVRLSATLLPAGRSQWAKAMFAELQAIEDDRSALDYAFGCLWASTKECILTLSFVARVVRIGTPSALLILALIAVGLTVRNAEVSLQVATVFGLSAAIFASAATLFLLKGIAAFGRAAGALTVLYSIAFLLVHSLGSFVATDAATNLYRALTIEGIFLWSALFIGTVFLIRMDRAVNVGEG